MPATRKWGISTIKRPVLRGSKPRLQSGSALQTALAWVGRVLRLDFTVFEEIRAEPAATTSAILVVYAASLLAGAGSWLWAVQSPDRLGLDETDFLVKSMIIGGLVQTIVWFSWVYVTYQVLVRAYGSDVHFLELIRTMGFAFAPVALTLLVAIGGFAVPFGLLAFGIALLISVSAVQACAQLEQREAMIATIAGFSVFLTFMGMCANITEVDSGLGGIAPGILFFSLDF